MLFLLMTAAIIFVALVSLVIYFISAYKQMPPDRPKVYKQEEPAFNMVVQRYGDEIFIYDATTNEIVTHL